MADFTDWVGAACDVVQAAAVGYGALKVAEWAEERRAVHRSEVATEAIAAGLALMMYVKSFERGNKIFSSESVAQYDKYAQSDESIYRPQASFARFLDAANVARAVLQPHEIIALLQIHTVVLRVQIVVAQHRRALEEREVRRPDREVIEGDFAKKRNAALIDAMLAQLQPVARVPPPPTIYERFRNWLARRSNDHEIDTF